VTIGGKRQLKTNRRMSNDEYRTAEIGSVRKQHFEIRHSAVRYSAVQNAFQDSWVMRTTGLIAVGTEVTGQEPE
jgi:hypothetical protein